LVRWSVIIIALIELLGDKVVEIARKISYLDYQTPMPDSIMYQGDYFLVLEADQPEQFQTPDELRDKLKNLIETKPEICARQLAKFSSLEEKAIYLRDNYCELDVGDGGYLQWYVVRLEK
jgi:Protein CHLORORESPIRATORY REDUCTION 7